MPKPAYNEPFGFASHPVASARKTKKETTEEPEVSARLVGKSYLCVGNESGASVEITAHTLSMNMNGDRILFDENDEIVGVFPPDYAVVLNTEEYEEDENE